MKGLLQCLVRRLFARSDQASKRAGVISAITLALLASLVPLIYHGLLEGGLILFGNLVMFYRPRPSAAAVPAAE